VLRDFPPSCAKVDAFIFSSISCCVISLLHSFLGSTSQVLPCSRHLFSSLICTSLPSFGVSRAASPEFPSTAFCLFYWVLVLKGLDFWTTLSVFPSQTCLVLTYTGEVAAAWTLPPFPSISVDLVNVGLVPSLFTRPSLHDAPVETFSCPWLWPPGMPEAHRPSPSPVFPPFFRFLIAKSSPARQAISLPRKESFSMLSPRALRPVILSFFPSALSPFLLV